MCDKNNIRNVNFKVQNLTFEESCSFKEKKLLENLFFILEIEIFLQSSMIKINFRSRLKNLIYVIIQ